MDISIISDLQYYLYGFHPFQPTSTISINTSSFNSPLNSTKFALQTISHSTASSASQGGDHSDRMERINVKEATIIRPAEETPKQCLQVSDLDLIVPLVWVPSVYFYRHPPNDDSSSFFEARLLKESLTKVLVPFYPVAGRLQKDKNGRIEILCNGDGVLFLEAETSCVIDDLGDFAQGSKLLPLLPTIDDTKDVYHQPLMMTQVTQFKCGSICIGFRLNHVLVDGLSAYYFINSWAEMTRNAPNGIPPPFFDRTLLSVGVPISPTFHHIEYDPPPSMNTPTENPGSVCSAILKLSLDQINTLKEKCKNDHEPGVKYSRTAILAAHIWHCVCKARGLSDDQASKMHFPTDGRSRLNPPFPSRYFGNVIFTTALIESSGFIQSKPLNRTVERIHKALKRMDDEYLKSALTYLKQQPDPTVFRRGANTYKCPNFNFVNLANMPVYDADFGWGKPVFVRLVNTYFEGVAHLYSSPSNDGSLSLIINLDARHMQLFKKFFYDIFEE